jgi:pyruvate dehydrogenase E2 component (dihydrolipoamide acetyltransferase)
VVEIKMPNLSQTTNEVMLIKWLIKPGDTVKKGQPLCEIESDKSVMEVESFTSGTVLQLLAEANTSVEAGTVIALIGEPGEKIEKTQKKLEKKQVNNLDKKKTNKINMEEKKEERKTVRASVIVKNLAAKKNVDLLKIKGSGPNNLITLTDLNDYIKYGEKKEKHNVMIEEEHLSQYQISTARNLTLSKSSIPHYYLNIQILMEGILKLRASLKLKQTEKISMYTFFIYAVSRALREVPRVNAYFKNNKIFYFKEINVGIAISAGDDLYVPVIKNSDQKEIEEINKEVIELVKKTKDKNLTSEEIAGGTFTISNLGTHEIDEFYPIINPSQAGILGIGKAKKTFLIKDDNSFSIRSVCRVGGSFDHRVVNGEQGAEFMDKFKKILERIE